MKRNRIYLLTVCLVLVSFVSSLSAQQRKRMNIVEFEKKKIEYIKTEAELTDQEAEKFFPIFNELTKKKFDLHKAHREKIEKLKAENKDMSAEEYRKLSENDREVKAKVLELENEYSKKMEKVLSPEKIYKVQQAEKKFMQKEVQRFRRSE